MPSVAEGARAQRGRLERAVSLGVAVAVCSGACLSRPPTLGTDTGATLFVRSATIGNETLDFQLVKPGATAPRLPLLLYATGDGGWRSADRGLFAHLARWGYPVAGFSARSYLEHLGFEATTRAQVARDYRCFIDFSVKALGLPGDTPTVLVGFSRGSGLAVVAAAQPGLQASLGGLLAVALDDEEEYVREYRTRVGRDPRDASTRELLALRPYELLGALDALPVGVIQSSNDKYLPAAQARELFGPDGERRRFYSIRARNHTFAGAREALYQQARVALEWILACGSKHALASTRLGF